MASEARRVTVLSAVDHDKYEAGDAVAHCIAALRERLPLLMGDGVDVVHHRLEEEVVAHCLGCFDCWTKTPGRCRIQDGADGIAASLIGSDLVVHLSALRFGSHSSGVKRALDRSIGLVEPFFQKQEGEVHHNKRYDHYPRTLSVAVAAPDTPATWSETFTTLVARNAVNMHAQSKALVIQSDQTEQQIDEAICAALEELIDFNTEFPMRHFEPLQGRATDDTWLVPPSPRTLVLVGSARPEGKSTSGSLAATLIDELAPLGFQSETIRLSTLLNRDTPAARTRLLSAVQRCDLLVLAAPLYVDALPALLLEALEIIADSETTRAPAVVGLLNCGFPEAEQCFVAVDILAHFCRSQCFPWLGAIALGGGEAISGRPLQELGGRTAHIRTAFQQAAAAIAQGRAIPVDVISAAAHKTMPNNLYTVAGGLGWRLRAWKEGGITKMHDRPFAAGDVADENESESKHTLTLLPDSAAAFADGS